ncbi:MULTISPECIES: tetratricopeptide repeat protein [unclassified Streptomyces]|uniref:tetratricopeptide repeat protein n=1 Tax=unclassified Streptomyces TaxID=2593676 RepID=UPI002E2D7751|nr:tetratricopeptide repeat protein [Streptomyces sp. NBC_00228]
MTRLSREKKREQKRAARLAPAASPFEVRVPVDGPGAGGASIGGVPVAVAAGEEIQQAVLSHLHRIATATGHPVHATIHDARIGYVVPLQIDPDGSSHFSAEPRAMGGGGGGGSGSGSGSGSADLAAAGAPPPPPQLPPAVGVTPEPEDRRPSGDPATHRLRAVPEAEAAEGVVPTFPLRAVPESAGESAPTFPLHAVPESARNDTSLGQVQPPTGAFGPPPTMDASPETPPALRNEPKPPAPIPAKTPAPAPIPDLVLTAPEPDPKPTPARGFDAVAEAVLGDDPVTTDGAGTQFLVEPMVRINDAVKAGRIEEAAALAERTVTDAVGALGAEHPEALRLRELAAYIAYLAGDPLRSFHLSLDLARIRHRAHDAESAYGNVQSAATAWRAVRDPEQGLALGRDLIDLWTGLAAEDGPAADDIEELESARARMGRLTERARKAGD